MLHFDVGIDPNVCLLAADTRLEQLHLPEGWFVQVLKRKDTFKTASGWEVYVLDQCIELVVKVNSAVKKHVKLHHEGEKYDISGAVEQQRGRVKSVIEAGLATAGRAYGWRVEIPHPTTWKKLVGLKWGEGNEDNKKKAVEAKYPELHAYCSEHGLLKTINKARIHDLCDAALLSEYSWKYRIGKK